MTDLSDYENWSPEKRNAYFAQANRERCEQAQNIQPKPNKSVVGSKENADAGRAFLSYGPFEMTEDGLCIEVERGKREAKTKECNWIAAPFEILGACRDPHGREWGKFLRWHDPDGRFHNRHVSDSALQGEPASICAALASDGMRINRCAQRQLVSYLSGATVKRRVTTVFKTGWHDIGGQSVDRVPPSGVAEYEQAASEARSS